MKENEAYMGGIEAKTKLLKAQFDLLVNGDGGLNSFIKGVLDVGTAILKFANSDVGGLIIKTTLLTTVLILLNSGLKGLSSALITAGTKAYYSAMGISAQAVATALANGATIGFTESLKALGVAFLKSPFAITALIVAGISALVKVVDHFSVSLKEASESLSENKSIFDETVSTLKTLNDKLEETKDRMNEIENFKAPTLTDKEELSSLKEQNTELERQISLENERQLQASKKLAESASQVLNTKITSTQQIQIGTSYDYDGKSTPVYGYSSEKITPEEELQRSMDMYKKLEQAIIDVNTAYDNGELTLEQYEEQQSGLQAQQDIARTRALEMVEITNASEQAYKGIIDSKGELTEAEQAEYDKVVLTNGQYYTFIDTITSDYVSATETMAEATEDATDSLSAQKTRLEELADVISSLNSQLDSLQSLQSTAKSAIEEFNENGAISVDTYQELLSYGVEYLTYLTNEEGQLLSTDEAIKNVTIARINDLALQKALEAVETAKNNSEQGKSFRDLASDIDDATYSLWGQVMAETSLAGVTGNNLSQVVSIIKSIQKWRDATIDGIKANTGFAKSSSSATNALKKQKEALEDNINKYKSAFKYVEKLLDKDIDKVNELKDAEMARIDASIKALEEQRTNEEEYWDDKISALEAQNDAIEDQIELEQLQANLALARSKRVMVMGTNGKFGYGQDEGAIADAEQALSDYTRQQQMETELAILNNLKDQSLANIDSQIGAWETYKESQEANFDSQIATLEAYKQNFEDMTNSYEDEQSRLNALQLFGADFEKQTWDTRLVNLANFVNEYNKLQAELGKSDTEQVPQTTTNTQYTEQVPQKPTNDKANRFIFGSKLKTEQVPLLFLDKARDSQIQSQRLGVHASGVSSVASDEIAVVGDNPNNRELVIGSKLNGTATMLSQGSGVVNAQSTKSLAGILNTLGSSMGLNGQTMGMNTTNQSNATSQSIQIANITLPSVTNGQGLLDELRGFASGMLQTAYSNG